MSETGMRPSDSARQKAFTTQLVALSLTKLGDALVSSRLVLAWMLTAIGSPGFLIATLVPLRESLSLLPQLFVAAWLHRYPVRKWFWVGGSLAQAIALCAMLVALLTLPGDAAGIAIVLLLALFSLARGICSVVVKEVLGKTVPRTRRGRLTGLSASAAGLASLAVAVLLWWSPRWGFGIGEQRVFAALLGVAALLWLLAAVIYSRVPERPGETTREGNILGAGLHSLSLVRTDRDFRHFVVARMLLVATAFAIPYIVVVLQRAGGSGIVGLAMLMLAEGAAGLLSGAIWGLWSDRASHRVMAASAALGATAIALCLGLDYAATAWLAEPLAGGALLFSAAVAHHGARIGRTTYLVDMASDHNRLQYTAVSNTVMGIFLLSGIGLGLLDAQFGIAAVLWFLLAVAVLAAYYCLHLPRIE